MAGADELFELRNYFVLGNYAAAVTEGTSIRVDDDGLRIDKDVILARVAIAQGRFDSVIDSVSAAESPVAMQAVRLLAIYQKDPVHNAAAVKTDLARLMDDSISSSNPTLLLMAALIYSAERDFDASLKAAHKGDSLEHHAAKVQVLLKMDRVDVAKKEVAVMKNIDEDATLTQLASAWVYQASGGTEAQEALFIFQDLLERHGSTDPILNGMSTSFLLAGRYDEAERTLLEALAKNSKNPDTLINVISCAMHKRKPAGLVDRYLAELRAVAPNHSWLRGYDDFNQKFEALSA